MKTFLFLWVGGVGEEEREVGKKDKQNLNARTKTKKTQKVKF